MGGPHHGAQALHVALLQVLVDIGLAVGHDYPPGAGRRMAHHPQVLRSQGRFARAALAGTGAVVEMRFFGFGHGLAHVVLLVQ